MGIKEKLPIVDELSEGTKRAYFGPIDAAGEGVKAGMDNAEKGIGSRQKEMQGKRTREENFIITIASSIAGLLGAYSIFINNNLEAGFILLIIAVIISVLPPLTPKNTA